MRKIITTVFLVFLTISLSAQDVISSFLDEYEKMEDLEVVTIGKKMLDLMQSLTPEDKEFTDVLKSLESIKVLNSSDSTLNKMYYESAYNLLTSKKNKNFEELVSFKGEENMLIMVKESKGIIKELVLLSDGGKKNQFSLISLSGNLKLEDLTKFSKALNINGLDKLDAVNAKK